MTQINAYLNFNGKCREAMTFYQGCLGGELMLLTVGESPMADQMPAKDANTIMHSTLIKGALVLMASDMAGSHLVPGNSVSLMLQCSSDAEIHEFFNALSSGGEVLLPLSDQFWGATFGHCIDKFGTNWLLNFDKSAA